MSTENDNEPLGRGQTEDRRDYRTPSGLNWVARTLSPSVVFAILIYMLSAYVLASIFALMLSSRVLKGHGINILDYSGVPYLLLSGARSPDFLLAVLLLIIAVLVTLRYLIKLNIKGSKIAMVVVAVSSVVAGFLVFDNLLFSRRSESIDARVRIVDTIPDLTSIVAITDKYVFAVDGHDTMFISAIGSSYIGNSDSSAQTHFYSRFDKKVFVSYSSSDEDTVVEIVNQLKSSGMRIWFAKDDLVAGGSLGEQIWRGLDDSDVGLAFIGKEYLSEDKQDPWTVAELCYMYDVGMHVIPIRIGISHDDVRVRFPPLWDVYTASLDELTKELGVDGTALQVDGYIHEAVRRGKAKHEPSEDWCDREDNESLDKLMNLREESR